MPTQRRPSCDCRKKLDSLAAARGERPADIIIHDHGGPLVENLPGKWDKAKVDRVIARLLGRPTDAE